MEHSKKEPAVDGAEVRPMPTILIVDDEADLRKVLRAILEKEHFRVIDCADGHEARMRVFEDPPDLIISDIVMPEMDGWAFVEEVRSLPFTRSTPFLFLTGHADSNTIREAERAGVDTVMTKPVKTDTLLPAIRSLLERKHTASVATPAEGPTEHAERPLPSGIETSLHIIADSSRHLRAALGTDHPELTVHTTKIDQSVERLSNTLKKLWMLFELEGTFSPAARVPGSSSLCLLAGSLLAAVEDVRARSGRTIVVPAEVPNIPLAIPPRAGVRLFKELLENAVAFSSPTDITAVEAEISGNRVQITVTDKGRGLTSVPINSLDAFDSFQQGRFRSKEHGLGLALVSSILRRYDGKITVSGRPGIGTRISISLPVDTVPA